MGTLYSGYFGTGLHLIKLNIFLVFTLKDFNLSGLKGLSINLINIFVNKFSILDYILFLVFPYCNLRSLIPL